MRKTTSTVPAISKTLTLAARAVARMEAAAQAVHAEANGERGFQAVSSKEGFSAVIRHGRTLIKIQWDDFAVRQTDCSARPRMVARPRPDLMHHAETRSTPNVSQYQVVLDVPEESVNIAFGLLLGGPGQVWMTNVHFETVSSSVPTTVLVATDYPDNPCNLNFDE